MSLQRQQGKPRPGAEDAERAPGIDELGAGLPMSDELRSRLLEIALGPSWDRDGEARALELESLVGYEVAPSATLMRRLREIPARNPVRWQSPPRPGGRFLRRRGGPAGSAALAARPGAGTALAASYLLAVALTLVLGDPFAAGRRVATNLGTAAGEHLLEPASEAGASMQGTVNERLGSLQGLWRPAGFFAEPLDLPTDRVSAWFRGAVESSSEALRQLTGLLPSGESDDDGKPPPTIRNRPEAHQDRSTA